MSSKSVLVLIAIIMVAAQPALAVTPASRFGTPQVVIPSDHESINLPADKLSAGPGQGLLDGADYLVHMQADVTGDNAGNGPEGSESPNDPDDAGWDWVVTSPPAPFFHTIAASPKNLYGVTALGIYYAYLREPKASYWTALSDAANHMLGEITIRTSGDMFFLMLYDDLPGVTGDLYRDDARVKFDWQIANHGGTATAFAQYVRDVRGVTQGYPNGIIGWDLGAYAVAAAMLDARYPGSGYDTAADDIAEVLWQDSFNDAPGLFDVVDDAGWDPTYTNVNYYWYCLGISGLIDAFSASGSHIGEIPGLIARVSASTFASGAVSGSYGANTGDEDWQATAYCAMTLGRYNPATYRAQVGKMAAWIGSTQDATSGSWLYSNGDHYPEVAGENTSALYYGTTTVGPVPPGNCISVGNTCVTVPVEVARMETANMRGYSVTFTLSPELVLCSGMASITEGTYLSSIGGTNFLKLALGGGQFQVDCAILGLPCGATTATGTFFNIAVMKAGGDGVGTITVDSVTMRDCANVPIQGAPGAPGSITIDATPPVALAGLLAQQQKLGNDPDGTTKVNVSFTPPSGGGYATTDIYRKGFGNYPEYDDSPSPGSVPSIPATPAAAIGAGWVLAGSDNDGAFADETTVRDFYYYVAFSKDDCGNVSAVSNMTIGTLNYHLGDISDGVAAGAGNNQVFTEDISLLGNTYGKVHGDVGYLNYADVGPTTSYSVDARPTTDNRINFEDLMMVAINYLQVGLRSPAPVQVSRLPVLQLTWDLTGRSVGTAHLRLAQNEGRVKGVHALIAYDRTLLELVGIAPGALSAQDNVFFKELKDVAGVVVDAAKLGAGTSFNGDGDVAILHFRVRAGNARATLAISDLRGVNNEFLDKNSPEIPMSDGSVVSKSARVEPAFLGAHPNPFLGQTEIRFRLAAEGRVTLRIFDASGRLVRTLADGAFVVGEHGALWDGRSEDGRTASPGVYFYTFQANGLANSRKLILLQ